MKIFIFLNNTCAIDNCTTVFRGNWLNSYVLDNFGDCWPISRRLPKKFEIIFSSLSAGKRKVWWSDTRICCIRQISFRTCCEFTWRTHFDKAMIAYWINTLIRVVTQKGKLSFKISEWNDLISSSILQKINHFEAFLKLIACREVDRSQ